MNRLLFLVALIICAQTFSQTRNPFRTETKDTIFGKIVADPYRSLEDTGNITVKNWMREQEDKTQAIFNAMPGRAKLMQKLVALNDSLLSEELAEVSAFKNDFFVIKRSKDSDYFNLYKVDEKGNQTLFLDPVATHPEFKTKNIRIYDPAFNADGTYMQYVLTVSGYEYGSQMRYLNLQTGKDLPDTVYSNVSRYFLAFDPADPKSFYYNYLPNYGNKAVNPRTWWDSSVVMRHTIDTDPKSDQVIVPFDTTIINRPATDPLALVIRKDLNYVLAVSQNRVNEEYAIWYAKLSDFKGVATPWKQITRYDDEVSGYEIKDNFLYLLTKKNASNSKVLRVDMNSPSLQTAIELIPESTRLLQAIRITSEQLLVSALYSGTGKIYGVKHGTNVLDSFPLPVNGFADISFASAAKQDFIIKIVSYVSTPMFYSWLPGAKSFRQSSIQNKSVAITNLPLEVKEVMVKGWDGTRVPMTIIHKKGLTLDGTHPVSLRAYGAYGLQDDPSFWPEDIIWYEMGGIRAIAHVRGGGVFGEQWHLAGKGPTKPNTWKDLISAGEYLIKNKYASSKTLCVAGVSAGGITVGRAITERPDLFAGAIIRVGALDMVRFELSPNGLSNIPEFGSVATEEGFKALYEMSAYHHIRKGVRYPAVLITHGVNDARVPVYNSTKMAAWLQEATTSGKPVLLHLNYDMGHGSQQTLNSVFTSIADNYSFYFWQIGLKEFQPATGETSGKK